MRGWRGLAAFWLGVGVIVVAGTAVLAWLGPPTRRMAQPGPGPWRAPPQQGWPGPSRLHEPTPIAAPDRLLLEAAPDFSSAMLPRIGPAGRTPSHTYAGAPGPADARPRIGLIVAGLGLDTADSLAAVAQLPPKVDFAVSAYTESPETVLAAMRAAGHEYLLSLPMEPQGYPDNDEGARQLLTGATLQDNYRNLEWDLSRLQGYAGATGASDGQSGERFAASPVLMAGVWQELASRGLFYIDPRPGAGPPQRIVGQGVDVVIDDPPDAHNIDAKLAQLEQSARQHGAAVGLAGRPSPVAVARIAAWAAGLAARGVALAPVSALIVQPPP